MQQIQDTMMAAKTHKNRTIFWAMARSAPLVGKLGKDIARGYSP